MNLRLLSFFIVLLPIVLTHSYAQGIDPIRMKKNEFRKSIQVSRLSVAAGGGINTNGNTLLGGLEYIAHYHFTADVTGFHRVEDLNNLKLTRTGIMAGLKSSVMGYLYTESYIHLGAGVSLMNQQAVDFESTRQFDPLSIGFYLSAEGFYEINPRWKVLLRFDQHFYPSELIDDKESLMFNHLTLMIRYKLPF